MNSDFLDVIAVGAHPDDVEIACGGTLAKLARQGHRVGIIDLTDGEPTPQSDGPETRLREAGQAAEVLGAAKRITLDLPNRRLFDGFEARLALAKEFRRYRPRLVIGLSGTTPQASPDHYQAGQIIDAAVFYSRLTKWEKHFGELPPHTIDRQLHCYLALRGPAPQHHQHITIDIADALEAKMRAIACYRSQFPPHKSGTIERIRNAALHHGHAAGFAAGEIVGSASPLGVRNLMGFLFED